MRFHHQIIGLPYEYIDAEANKKLYKTKRRLSGNEM